MTAVRARHVICVLHDDLEVLAKIAARFPGFLLDREHSIDQPDDRMLEAFHVSMDRVEPSFTKADWRKIERHRAVGYVVSPRITRANARAVSTSALRLVKANQCNGRAIREAYKQLGFGGRF